MEKHFNCVERFSGFLLMAGSLEMQNSRCLGNTPPTACGLHCIDG